MFALCTIVTFLRPVRERVLEGEFQQAAASLAGIDSGGHGDRVRIVVDLDVVLVADVQALEILAHHHEIDVLEAAAGNERARRAKVRVQLELLAQPHVRGPIAAARGRLERAFQCEARAPDAVEGGRRQRIAHPRHALEPGDLPIPFERSAERIERGESRIDDLRADAVAGNQGGGNGFFHRSWLFKGMRRRLRCGAPPAPPRISAWRWRRRR